MNEYCAGMAPVKVPDNVIDLSQYIDRSKYTIYGSAHARLSASYRVYSKTNITLIDKPGLFIAVAYRVSTVTASENSSINRKSTTRFPTSYRRTAYVTTLPRAGLFPLLFAYLICLQYWLDDAVA